MATTRSKPRAWLREPSPGRCQSVARSARRNRSRVSQVQAPSSSQMPQRLRKRRTKVSGPATARAVARAPKTRVQSTGEAQPCRPQLPSSTLAASRITTSSKAPQPISWVMLSTAGNSAPRWPRLWPRAVMPARPVSLPTRPAAASSSTPTAVPSTSTSRPSARPSPGASSAPAWATIRPMPRENQRVKRSRPPRMRRSAGTGTVGV